MTPSFSFEAVTEADFEALLALRISTLRESLERLGRFDPVRARERFRGSFRPQHTRRIRVEGAAAGFVATWPEGSGVRLEHFYIAAAFQRLGLGSAVVKALLDEPAHAGLPFLVAALRASDANRFYLRHGFVVQAETEWDVAYVRAPDAPAHHHPP